VDLRLARSSSKLLQPLRSRLSLLLLFLMPVSRFLTLVNLSLLRQYLSPTLGLLMPVSLSLLLQPIRT